MPHEDQFTATGPAFSGSAFPFAGFSNASTDSLETTHTYGVNVIGTECGVYGESVNTPPPTDREKPSGARIGVCGVGDTHGVFGMGFEKAGVQGENANATNGVGVFGLARDQNTNGVVGISKVAKPVEFPDARGAGVVGATECGGGFGVIGLSCFVNSLSDEATQIARPSIDDQGKVVDTGSLGGGIGVFGASGNGTGVYGYGKDFGTGVYGLSSNGRGGEFESMTLMAQVRLVPFKKKALFAQLPLPKNGKVGDMLMIRNTAENQDGQTEDRCSLWLCVPTLGQPGFEDSSQWQEVVLGNSVTGQA
jgi:hypothetical protein